MNRNKLFPWLILSLYAIYFCWDLIDLLTFRLGLDSTIYYPYEFPVETITITIAKYIFILAVCLSILLKPIRWKHIVAMIGAMNLLFIGIINQEFFAIVRGSVLNNFFYLELLALITVIYQITVLIKQGDLKTLTYSMAISLILYFSVVYHIDVFYFPN